MFKPAPSNQQPKKKPSEFEAHVAENVDVVVEMIRQFETMVPSPVAEIERASEAAFAATFSIWQ